MDLATFLRRVGDNLRKARWLAGLTQEQVAARGISYRYYQELERGVRNPTIGTLFALAEILGTSVWALTEVEPLRSRERVPLYRAKASPPRRGRKPRRAPHPAG